MFAGLCAFLAGVPSQAGDADSSRPLVSPLVLGRNQGSLHAHFSSQSFQRTLRNVYGVGSPTVFTTSSVHLHTCAATYVTEFFLSALIPFSVLPFWLPFGIPVLGAIFFVFELFNRPFCYEISTRKKRIVLLVLPLDVRFFRVSSLLLCFNTIISIYSFFNNSHKRMMFVFIPCSVRITNRWICMNKIIYSIRM